MKALLKLLVIAVMVLAANTAGATVVNFDDLGPVIGAPDPNNPNSGIGVVPAGYAGFSWGQFDVIDKDYYPGTSYQYGTVSGNYAVFNLFAEVATVAGTPFVFRSAYLTAAWDNTLAVTVTGYREGSVVYTQTVNAVNTGPILFAFPTVKVDSLKFSSPTEFVMDDFTYATIPVVDAGQNIKVSSENQHTIIINGIASDGDGSPLVYRWLEGQNVLSDWRDVGPNGAANLDLGSVPSLSAGDHTLTLEVKLRDADIMDTADMILTISNSAPHAAPTGAGTYVDTSPVTLGGEVSDYDGDTLTYQWLEGSTVLFEGIVTAISGGASVPLPNHIVNGLNVGTHTLTLRVSDGTNAPVSKEISVNVIDVKAPTLAPKPDKTILWPPFHQMVPVTIVANAVDDSGGPVTLTATVTSNEPHIRRESHEPELDWTTPVIDQANGIITLKLRAERNPGGKGREYTITITATDQSGNSSQAAVKITVGRVHLEDCDYWWSYWHNYNQVHWNDPGYKKWFDGFYSDWFNSWKH